jgi:4'-phosphopantetheinyl transferase
MQSLQPAMQCEDVAAVARPCASVRLLRTEALAGDDPRLVARLDAHEAARAAKFREAADRDAYVGAHALLRTLLSQAVPGASPPREWRFVEGARGKPRLAAGQAARDLRFNLSHCRGMVAVALAERADIGIDIEGLDRHDFDDRAIAASHFCAVERDELARITGDAERKQAFLALWTAKEALIKALGDGLSMPLDGFRADLERGGYVRYDAPRANDEWRLARWQPAGYLVALAAPAGTDIECREVRWDASACTFIEGPVLKPSPGAAP